MGASTDMKVEQVESGDVVSYRCVNDCCKDSDDPTRGKFLVLEVGDDGKLSISSPDHLSLKDDDVHYDGQDTLTVKLMGLVRHYKITSVDKGAGAELVAMYEKYKPLRQKHLDTDMTGEEYVRIMKSDKDLLKMLELTILDPNTTKTVTVSMVFELLGIKATKEQMVRASILMAGTESPLAGSDIGSALMAMMAGGI